MKRVELSVEDSFFSQKTMAFLQFQNFAFEIEFESESESSLRFTAQVYGQGLRADIALRIAYPLFIACLRAKMIQK